MSQQINLFNPLFVQKKRIFSAAAVAAGLGVLTLGLAGLGFAAKLRTMELQAKARHGAEQVERAQKRLAAVGTEFAPRQKDPNVAAELDKAQAELLGLKEVSDTIKGGELGNVQGYAEYFRALARQSVEGLWLTGVNIAGAGLDIGVRGRAMDPAMVPGFLGRLRNERVMQGKAVGNLQIGEAPALKVLKDGKESPSPAPYVEFNLQSAAPARNGGQK